MATDSYPKRDVYHTRLFSRKGDWFPRRLGPAHYLYSFSEFTRNHYYQPPFFSLALDSPKLAPQWKTMDGLTVTESLFALLYPLFRRYGCTLIYATLPDGGAITTVKIDETIQEQNAPRFTPAVLEAFERIPADQGGPRCLALFFEQIHSAIAFDYYTELSIALHAPENTKHEILSLLNTDATPDAIRVQQGLLPCSACTFDFQDPVITLDSNPTWSPSNLGERRTLYRSHIGNKYVTFFELILNPPSLAPIWPLAKRDTPIPWPPAPAWSLPDKHTFSSSLFAALKALIENYSCRWLHLSTDPEKNDHQVKSDSILNKEATQLRFLHTMLRFAEDSDRSETNTTAQTMIYYFEAQGGAFVFRRSSFLEIDFYGCDSFWHECNRILELHSE